MTFNRAEYMREYRKMHPPTQLDVINQREYMREYRKIHMPAYRAAHPELFREFDKRRYQTAKLAAWSILGSSCATCNEIEKRIFDNRPYPEQWVH